MLKRLMNKLIHRLGGYTFQDMLKASRPSPVGISKHDIQTIRVCQTIPPDMLSIYPEIVDKAKDAIACRISERMLAENLIQFRSVQELTSLYIEGTAMVVTPEVSECQRQTTEAMAADLNRN